MRITVDTQRCCGSGNCVLIAPEVFDQTEDEGVVLLLQPEPARALWAAVEEAVRVCPTEAIAAVDDGRTTPR